MEKVKVIFLFFVIIILSNCATKKAGCDAYSKNKVNHTKNNLIKK